MGKIVLNIRWGAHKAAAWAHEFTASYWSQKYCSVQSKTEKQGRLSHAWIAPFRVDGYNQTE